jgi:hypothetical protein
MSSSRSAPPMEAPLPQHISVVKDSGVLTITYRWFRPLYLFTLLFCIVWDASLVVWYRTALRQADGAPGMAFWFPLLHVAIGVVLTYTTLAGLLNRTRIVVQSREIVIQHGPIPSLGNRRIGADGIRQIYREQTFSQYRGSTSASFHLNAITQDNRKLPLVRDVPSADMALYLEQEIEKALGIEDRRVAGEMQK